MSDDTPTGPPITLACGHCTFTTQDPGAIVLHMIETGHGLSTAVRADMIESGLPHELAEKIGQLQRGDFTGAEPVTSDDDDEP